MATQKISIKWRKTSMGGYMANGNALLRSWSAYISPPDFDSPDWYASVEVNRKYKTTAHKTAGGAKRWCAKEVAYRG